MAIEARRLRRGGRLRFPRRHRVQLRRVVPRRGTLGDEDLAAGLADDREQAPDVVPDLLAFAVLRVLGTHVSRSYLVPCETPPARRRSSVPGPPPDSHYKCWPL